MRRVVALATRHWRWTLVAWLLLVLVSGAFAPNFVDVATYDDNAFLPSGSMALEGAYLLEEGWPEDNFTSSGVVVLLRGDAPLGDSDRDYARQLVAWMRSDAAPEGLGRITTHLEKEELTDALTSDDGQAMLIIAGFDVTPFSPIGHEAVTAVRERIATQPPPDGLQAMFSGAAGIAYDENQAIEASVERTEVLTVLLVLVLVLWVLRSPVAALVPLVTVAAAYIVSLAVVGLLARYGMDVSYLFQVFAIVIVFGAGTDYALLILSRYSEELLLLGDSDGTAVDADESVNTASRHRALIGTMAVLVGVLASTAASTMVGFSAQIVAQFGLFRTMGPALAIAVFITFIAGVTLTPAIMRLFGGWLFWPADPTRLSLSMTTPDTDEPADKAQA